MTAEEAREIFEKYRGRLTPEMIARIEQALRSAQRSHSLGPLKPVLDDIKAQLKLEDTMMGFRISQAKASSPHRAATLESIMRRSKRILKDPSWLGPLSDPPKMQIDGRDYSLSILRGYIAESLRTNTGRSIFLFGPPGTGKTLCAKRLLLEVHDYIKLHGGNGYGVYVNAGRTRTPYYTLAEVIRAMGANVPASGWQFTRLKLEFERLKDEKPTVIVVDEVDVLLPKEREPIIYYLNRQPYITLVLISNRFKDLEALPQRARSSLQPIPLIFQPYDTEAAYVILSRRAKHAFQAGAAPSSVIRAIANRAARLGDIRVGFNLLLMAGITAEAAGKKKISQEDVNSLIPALDAVLRR